MSKNRKQVRPDPVSVEAAVRDKYVSIDIDNPMVRGEFSVAADSEIHRIVLIESAVARLSASDYARCGQMSARDCIHEMEPASPGGATDIAITRAGFAAVG